MFGTMDLKGQSFERNATIWGFQLKASGWLSRDLSPSAHLRLPPAVPNALAAPAPQAAPVRGGGYVP